MSELDKALAAVNLGDILLNNATKEIEKLKHEKAELTAIIELLLDRSEIHMTVLENRLQTFKLDLSSSTDRLKRII